MPSGAWWPLWVGDGERIVYHRHRSSPQGFVLEFVVIDANAAVIASWAVPRICDERGVSLSPDGLRVLFTDDCYSIGATWAVHLETGAIEHVVAGSGGVLSPDGDWIAYWRPQQGLLIAPLGQPPVGVLADGWGATWMAGSRHVVCSRERDLVMASRDGTDLLPLTNDPEIEWYPRVTPAGDRVLYTRWADGSVPPSVWQVELPPVSAMPAAWSRIRTSYR